MVKYMITPHQIRFYRHNKKKKKTCITTTRIIIIYLYAHCTLYIVENRVKHNGMFSDELEGKKREK